MEPSTLIPLVAVVVGVPGFVAFVALIGRHQHKMKALAIREKELDLGGSADTVGPALEALTSDLNDVRAKVADLQERVDFAERLLVAGSLSQTNKGG